MPDSSSSHPPVGVSVALCTWNGHRWVGALLESLAAQELLPDELVVQDDGSDDGTVELVEQFAADAPFPVLIEVNEERVGSTANFAIALGRCRGRMIALADQDDVWYPSKLRRLVDELTSDPTITLVFSDADLIGEDGRMMHTSLWEVRLVDRALRRRTVVPEELFARRAVTTGCTMVVRRRAAEAALPFPPELDHPTAPMRHDRWLSMVAAAVGTVRALPDPLLAFRVHPAQETGVLAAPELSRALRDVARRVAFGSVEGHGDALRARAAQLRVAAERATELGDFQEAALLRRIATGLERRARITEPGPSRWRIVVDGLRDGTYPVDGLGVGAFVADTIRSVRPAVEGGRR